MNLSDILHYPFMLRALAAGVLMALLCGVLGIFLVLRRISLIGDGLAHVSFGAVAAALFAGVASSRLTIATVPLVLFASLAIQRITATSRIHGDAAIGIVSAAGISAGILFASLGGGSPVEIMGFLFGNILSIGTEELVVAAVSCTLSLAGLLIFYRQLFAATFDEELARTSGIRVERLATLLTVVTAVTVVLAMRLVGVMLVSALLIIPASTALSVARGFRGAILVSVLVALFSVIVGVLLSFAADLPTGATIIAVALFCFVAARLLDGRRRGSMP